MNQHIVTEPTVLDFSGFDVDKEYTTTLKIFNRYKDPVRIRACKPALEAISLGVMHRMSLPPGGDDALDVSFKPKAWTSYDGSIRLETDKGYYHLVQVVAKLQGEDMFAELPRRVEFGIVSRGKSAEQTIRLVNSRPFGFEFRIVSTGGVESLTVRPDTGIVRESAVITITYSPTTLSTLSATLLVQVANSDTCFKIEVHGSSRVAPERSATMTPALKMDAAIDDLIISDPGQGHNVTASLPASAEDDFMAEFVLIESRMSVPQMHELVGNDVATYSPTTPQPRPDRRTTDDEGLRASDNVFKGYYLDLFRRSVSAVVARGRLERVLRTLQTLTSS